MVNILNPTEYILNHGDLVHQRDRGDSASANIPCFKEDVLNGRLNNYKETFVAYQKGILCGQSKNQEELFKKATGYYGFSSLAVFMVPKEISQLENSIKEARGHF
jgi:hypothetical protein